MNLNTGMGMEKEEGTEGSSGTATSRLESQLQKMGGLRDSSPSAGLGQTLGTLWTSLSPRLQHALHRVRQLVQVSGCPFQGLPHADTPQMTA